VKNRGRPEEHTPITALARLGQCAFKHPLANRPSPRVSGEIHLSQFGGTRGVAAQRDGADEFAVRIFNHNEPSVVAPVVALDVVEIGVGAGRVGGESVFAECTEDERADGVRIAIASRACAPSVG